MERLTHSSSTDGGAGRARNAANWRRPAIAGYTVIFLTFGIVGGWAAVAKLDRAVVAPATVAIESNRKTVQHFEGGIVREVMVKDGQQVAEGDVLFRLEAVQAKASSELLRNQLDAALVLEARLVAERDRKAEMALPAEIEERRSNAIVARAIVDQTDQFRQRRGFIDGQVGIFESKINQLRTEMQGVAIEKDSTEKQVAYINDELVGLRQLRSKDLIPVSRVLSMERERTRLEGIIGRAIAETAKAENAISEARLQIDQLHQKFQEEVAASILEVRQRIADAREKFTVAEDVLRRVEIRAPRGGMAQNLKVFTVGQVIRSGEPMLEIVPTDETLVVQAMIAPQDIDTVHAGLQAEIRFPAFQANEVPIMLGRLEFVSRDRLVDEATRQPYYMGHVSVSKIDIPETHRSRLRAGMPAEVILATGERTVLSYLVSPLSNSLRKSFTER